MDGFPRILKRMLALRHRFHGHNSLRPLYQKGRPVYSKNLKLLWLPAGAGGFRVAVVVSKKVHKSAVVRNRIRRRVYELTRRELVGQAVGVDLIYIAQTPALAAVPAAAIEAEVTALLKKIPGLLSSAHPDMV